MTKVDRALEMQVIDWLQWGKFPEDNNLPALALELINKRKQETVILRDAVKFYADPEHWTIPWVEGSYGDYGTIARKALIDTGSEPEGK